MLCSIMNKKVINIVMILLIFAILGNCKESASDVKTTSRIDQTEKIEDSIRTLELKFKL